MFECLLEEKELDDQHTKAEFLILRIYPRQSVPSLPLKGDLVQYFSKEERGG
jgi:hypothetical protein